jgi:hypothetical protein
MKSLFDMRYTLIFSALCGYALATSGATLNLFSLYDHFFPVVTMQGKLVGRGDDGSVFVHITGTKNRDCQFLQIDSYSTNKMGFVRDANEERVGGYPVNGASKPVGTYDLGVWRVFPVDKDAIRSRMYVEHSCNRRIVYTLISDVAL